MHWRSVPMGPLVLDGYGYVVFTTAKVKPFVARDSAGSELSRHGSVAEAQRAVEQRPCAQGHRGCERGDRCKLTARGHDANPQDGY